MHRLLEPGLGLLGLWLVIVQTLPAYSASLSAEATSPPLAATSSAAIPTSTPSRTVLPATAAVPDLTVTVTASYTGSMPVPTGATFTFIVQNIGTAPAPATTLHSALATGLVGQAAGPGCTLVLQPGSIGALTCQVPPLSPGSSAGFTLTA